MWMSVVDRVTVVFTEILEPSRPRSRPNSGFKSTYGINVCHHIIVSSIHVRFNVNSVTFVHKVCQRFAAGWQFYPDNLFYCPLQTYQTFGTKNIIDIS